MDVVIVVIVPFLYFKGNFFKCGDAYMWYEIYVDSNCILVSVQILRIMVVQFLYLNRKGSDNLFNNKVSLSDAFDLNTSCKTK